MISAIFLAAALTCSAPVPSGAHQVTATVYYQHRAQDDGNSGTMFLARPYRAIRTTTVNGPATVRVQGDGVSWRDDSPVGIEIEVDGAKTFCGRMPTVIFVADQETGDLSQWDWSSGRRLDAQEDAAQ